MPMRRIEAKSYKADPDPLLLHEYQALIAALPPKTGFDHHCSRPHGNEAREILCSGVGGYRSEKGEIHVSRSLTNKRVFVPPKQMLASRTIPLLKPA